MRRSPVSPTPRRRVQLASVAALMIAARWATAVSSPARHPRAAVSRSGRRGSRARRTAPAQTALTAFKTQGCATRMPHRPKVHRATREPRPTIARTGSTASRRMTSPRPCVKGRSGTGRRAPTRSSAAASIRRRFADRQHTRACHETTAGIARGPRRSAAISSDPIADASVRAPSAWRTRGWVSVALTTTNAASISWAAVVARMARVCRRPLRRYANPEIAPARPPVRDRA